MSMLRIFPRVKLAFGIYLPRLTGLLKLVTIESIFDVRYIFFFFLSFWTAERLSSGDNTAVDVKHPTTSATKEDAIEQALAQTIVTSLLQKQHHENLESYLMPGILITPHNFQITMYDAENDILLCSNEIPLFLPPSDYCLNPRAVLTLWLVLHYKMFCSGLKLVDSYTLNKWKSNFKVFVDSKWEIYSTLLKDSVSSFSVAECMYNWKEMNMYTQSYLPGNC